MQLSDGVVSFVCAVDNPRNQVDYYVGNCRSPTGGEIIDACHSAGGQAYPQGATGYILQLGESGGLESLNRKWSSACLQNQGTPSEITGPPVSHDEGMKQIGH